MVLTFSRMFPLGQQAPYFELPNVIDNKTISINDLKSEKATVLMFICNHCPYVKHYNQQIADISQEYMAKGFAFAAISANDADSFPDDAPEQLKQQALAFGFNFPYLFDKSQQTAKAYMAACTPDFFVFDKNMNCVYRGQLDNSRPKTDIPVTGSDLRKVLDTIIEGKKVSEEQTPSSGCNIKWKPGISPF